MLTTVQGPSEFSVLLHGLSQHSAGEEEVRMSEVRGDGIALTLFVGQVEEAVARRLEQSPLRFASAFSNWSVLGSIRSSESVRVSARIASLCVYLSTGQVVHMEGTQASVSVSSVGRLSFSVLCERGWGLFTQQQLKAQMYAQHTTIMTVN
jgi:hypothetical protein